MLKPADGVEGVKKFVLDTVEQAGANPCPPIVLGIGIVLWAVWKKLNYMETLEQSIRVLEGGIRF